ncbi:MAG: hypothetical protein V3G42_01375 [Oscillospiraceae bacterium]
MDFDPNSLKKMLENVPDSTEQYDYGDIEQNKIVAAITTVPFFFWLPLVVNTDSNFGKFYANQGLILTIVCIVLGIVDSVIGRVLWMIPLLGHILSALFALIVTLVALGAWLFLLVNALQGKAKELPLIGNIFRPFK